jgi:hypothetical protein
MDDDMSLMEQALEDDGLDEPEPEPEPEEEEPEPDIKLATPLKEEWEGHYAYLYPELDERRKTAFEDLEYHADVDIDMNRHFNAAAWYLALEEFERMIEDDDLDTFVELLLEIGVLEEPESETFRKNYSKGRNK